MEIKNAIHCQKVQTEEAVCEECELYSVCTHETQADIARLSISALEKQTAKKIIIKTQDGKEYEDFICPGCNRIILQRSKAAMPLMPYKESYCRKCGQALDWN